MTTKKKVDGINEICSFSIEDPDMDVFNDLPDWLQQKIEEAPEWSETTAEEEAAPAAKQEKKLATDEIDVDDVPF